MVNIKTVVIILKILADFIVHRNFGNCFKEYYVSKASWIDIRCNAELL